MSEAVARIAQHVDAALEAERLALLDQRAAEQPGHDADGDVDEEDPVPVERVDDHAAQQQADGAAGHGDEGVDAHRGGALGRARELGGDDGHDDRGADGRPTRP
jgi:hypothetical protein